MTQATREVRFAVVLYGGTSLAIYMNGISQELLRMVRGGSDETGLDEVERIYREIAEDLHVGGRTRFVIDIISGTSAGGINGVALAKALVTGSANLDVLRDTWTDKAHIDKLLDDRGLGARWSRSESLLDGKLLYDLVHDTLKRMGEAGSGKPLVEMIDLFVTATDLRGRPEPVQLTGTSIDEPVHKTVFRFAYEKDRSNDFGDDAMLAFAARCTASFPIAFPPMRLGDAPPLRKRNDLDRFFPGGKADRTRPYADGGYLDVKPFSYAIDLIPFRPMSLPGERKLLFIDPFPEGRSGSDHDEDENAGQEIDFIVNARLAATTIPRREVIREDIRQINAINRRLERLGALHDRWSEDTKNPQIRALLAGTKPANIERLYLDDLVNGQEGRVGYGAQYPLYHHLRVYGTADMLSGLVAGLAGVQPESGHAAYLRQVVRAWRDARYAAYRAAPNDPEKLSETQFLAEYDLDFRRRRLVHLRSEVAKALPPHKPADGGSWPAVRELWSVVEAQLGHLRRMAHATAGDREALLGSADVRKIFDALTPGYRDFAAQPGLEGKYEVARTVYETGTHKTADGRIVKIRDLVDNAMAAIEAALRKRFDLSSADIQAALKKSGNPAFAAAYDGFHWHDIVTFPFLEGTSAEEHAEVQVFRISPADSDLDGRADKLAGISYGAFGGFLSRDWREHDILWGRLDGAERIVTALMPSPGQAAKRAGYIGRLREAILRQEFGAASKSRREAMARRLIWQGKEHEKGRDGGETPSGRRVARQVVRLMNRPAAFVSAESFARLYDKPLPPATRDLAGWGSRAGRILAQMLDDLPPGGALRAVPSRLAGPLRTGSVLAGRLALFAAPGGYHGLLAGRLLMLAMLIGATLLAVAWLSPGSVSPAIGAAILGLALAIWLVLYVAGRVLRGRTPLPRAAKWLAILGAAVLIVVGAWSVFEFARSNWGTWSLVEFERSRYAHFAGSAAPPR